MYAMYVFYVFMIFIKYMTLAYGKQYTQLINIKMWITFY